MVTESAGDVGAVLAPSLGAELDEVDESAGLEPGGVAVSSFFLGRKAALMSPIPTKNSSAYGDNSVRRDARVNWQNCDEQGITLTRFGEPSQTSARSSMMTTMLVSQGNRRCRFLRVMPGQEVRVSTRQFANNAVAKSLTPTLISTQNPCTKELALGINHFAHLDGVGSCAHRVDVHLVDFGERREKVLQSRPARERKDIRHVDRR